MRYILLIMVVGWCINLGAFHSAEQIAHYTEQHLEEPEYDYATWLDTDYSTFRKQSRPSFFDNVKHFFGFSNYHFIKSSAALKALEEINQQRASHENSHYALSVTCAQNSQWYVYGNLAGALHSLQEYIQWLIDQGLLTNELVITKPNVFLLFNGNAVDKGPYNLETLLVIIALMKANPQQVFYCKGEHETNKYWHDFGLMREVKALANKNSLLLSRLIDSIDTFFSTLPLALFISTKTKPEDVIRISYFGREDELYNIIDPIVPEQPCTGLTISSIDLSQKASAQDATTSDVRAVIMGDRPYEPRAFSGLGMLGQDMGATVWSVLSSPIIAHQTFLNFNYDAFALLNVSDSIDTSTITLYRQARPDRAGFTELKTHNIVSRFSPDSPYFNNHKEPIKIGSTMALIRGWPVLGQHIKRGISVRVTQQNEQGGIDGHPIRFFVYNDDHIPNNTRTLVYNMVQKGIDIFGLGMGSANLGVYKDLLREKKVISLFPVTGAPQFRTAENDGIIFLRPSYALESKLLVRYLVQEYGIRKFAFFYQDDVYGTGPLQGAHKALQELGINDWIDIPYTRGATDLSVEAKKIKQEQPEALGFFSVAQQTQDLIRQIGVDSLASVKLFAISPLADESFRAFINQLGLQVTYSSAVPNPTQSDLVIAQEYREQMNKNNYSYDTASFESYIAVSIIIEMFKDMQPPFTKEKLLEKIISLKDYPFKGLVLTYDPQERDLSQPVWIETESDKPWIKYSKELS